MKKIKTILLLAAVCSSGAAFAQNCCSHPGSIQTFAQFSQDPQFISSHLDPLPFMLTDPLGKDISFKTPDGSEGYGYEIKNEKPTNNYVLVIHEWWGLNDYIRQESEKIFSTLGNVNVIAIDLYDKKVAANKDSAAKYMQSVQTARAEAIIKGAISYAGKKADIFTIGWCFGGGWSMQAALLAGKQCKACVMYYGMPEEKLEKLKDLRAPVLFIWAQKDQWINEAVVEKFESNMKSLGKKLQVKKYDADHAFANPSNPKFNKEYAEDAFTNAIAFFRKNIK
jgi:carboxymethylenebutenolidase